MQVIQFRQRRRAGFTLLELLVVISIIALLVSLILPAVQSARMAARRLQCQNRIRNLALALRGYEAAQNGSFPSVIYSDNGVVGTWADEILPFVDAQSVADQLDISSPPNVKLNVFVCPDDQANVDYKRGLSYVLNVGIGLMTPSCGSPPIHSDTHNSRSDSSPVVRTTARTDGFDGYYVDWDTDVAFTSSAKRLFGVDWDQDGALSQNEDRITLNTGVFWSHTRPRNRAFNADRINLGDGAGNTLMIAERNRLRDWASPPAKMFDILDFGDIYRYRFLALVGSHGFGMSTSLFRHSGQHAMPKMGGWVSQPTLRELAPREFITNNLDCSSDQIGLNQVINNESVYFIAPMSAHPGGANVAFCDGRVVFLSEDLSPLVFSQLLTSGGARHAEPILSDNAF